MSYFIDENEIVDKRTTQSLSNDCVLELRYYTTKEGCWNYSRGLVRNVVGDEIADIQRNYGRFHHDLFTVNGESWLVSGRSYMSQTFVNLTTGLTYDSPANEATFCWASPFKVSPLGNVLAVFGCYWGGPYEWKFFDVSDIPSGWPEIPILDETGEETALDADLLYWRNATARVVVTTTLDCDCTTDTCPHENVPTDLYKLALINGNMQITKHFVPAHVRARRIAQAERNRIDQNQRNAWQAESALLAHVKYLLSDISPHSTASEIHWSWNWHGCSGIASKAGEENNWFFCITLYNGRYENRHLRSAAITWGAISGDIRCDHNAVGSLLGRYVPTDYVVFSRDLAGIESAIAWMRQQVGL